MDRETVIRRFFQEVIDQNEAALPAFFADGAAVRWHCTNEDFTAAEYIRANCEYPGTWKGEIERLALLGETAVSAARVWSADGAISCHVVSFYEFEGERIRCMDEYWGDDGPAPGWRQALKLGRPIHEENGGV